MKYKCITGYEPTTTPEVQCMGNGEWSLPEFHCVVCKSNYFLFCIHHQYLDSKYYSYLLSCEEWPSFAGHYSIIIYALSAFAE